MRGRYITEPRKEVLSCLAAAKEGHLTAAEVCHDLKQKGSAVSTATVYRQLDHLVAEGVVVRFTPEGERAACFQLLDQDHCHDVHCYHLKCEECGALIHLNCDELSEAEKHLLDKHGFAVNPGRTVLYGVCHDCQSKEAR